MDNRIEDCVCIHAWSLKNEGLLERDLAGRSRPISLWYLIHCVDGRKWQRVDQGFTVSLAPPSLPRSGLVRGTDYQIFKMTWTPPNAQQHFALFTAVNTLRAVGKNVGQRWWFLCPLCGDRATALYFRRELGCRRCHRLVYQSRSFSRKRRAWNRAVRSE